MSVAKVVEMVGSSPNNWEEALRNVIEEAKKLGDVRGVDVLSIKAVIREGTIKEWRTVVKIAYV